MLTSKNYKESLLLITISAFTFFFFGCYLWLHDEVDQINIVTISESFMMGLMFILLIALLVSIVAAIAFAITLFVIHRPGQKTKSPGLIYLKIFTTIYLIISTIILMANSDVPSYYVPIVVPTLLTFVLMCLFLDKLRILFYILLVSFYIYRFINVEYYFDVVR
ncbi:hypothetical protein JD969_13380 [Planctomycetota bacterium]|nr:hypothetical protein JD969_13380 [Planctomycetota bacterium]